MGCTQGKVDDRKALKYKQDKEFLRVKQRLSDSELNSLCIIYKDLSYRDPSQKLNLENFQLFFHKNGFWGQKLFKEFDSDQSGMICEKQFIKGIARIFKTSQDEKIKLLYHFFEKEGREGISFNDFVVVLYNYPKSDLKQIFDDQEFVEDEIKKKLIEIRKNTNNGEIHRNESGQLTQYRIDGSDTESETPIPSAYGFKGILEDLKCKRLQQQDKASLNIKLNGRAVEVRTSNIQHLVKKFARKLFKQYNINEKTGKLEYKDFYNWIQGHKNLYKNYYEGFHNQVWEDQGVSLKPRYLTSKNEKQSSGKMYINSVFASVHIYFLNSTIIISKQEQKDIPIYIICLDGLAVKKVFDQGKGFGIEICHRDGIYPMRTFFLRNQETATQWMQLLKFFKGTSAQQMYDIGEKIGTGKFSIVYACRQKKTNRQYAIKVIQSSKLDAEARHLIAHQTSIMNVLNYPLLVYFKQSIQTKTHLYIVTELIKGKDLFEYIKQHGPLKEVQAANVIRQLILGVKHLHEMGIVHRDLKPENIMIVTEKNRIESESVKIIDFGFSNYKTALANLDPSRTPRDQSCLEMLAGTPSYIAPQILRNDDQLISQKIDNFAIGAIIYFVLSGTVPFNGQNINQMFQKTIYGAYSFDHKVWRSVGIEAKDLIDKLLLSQPEVRMTLEEALKHPWFLKTCTKQGRCKKNGR